MDNRTEKIEKLVNHMKNKEIGAIFLSPSSNMQYITGFNTFPGERLLVSIITNNGKVIFIAPRLYEQEIMSKAHYDNIYTWDDTQDPREILINLKKELKLTSSKIAIDDTMWFSVFNTINGCFENVIFIGANEIISELRVCKADDELAKLRKSSQMSDLSLEKTIEKIKTGMKENEIKNLLENEMRKVGFSSVSFDTIIGSGPNSALPHYTAADRVINDGDSIVIDFGGIYENYCSDMTRTLMMGSASEDYKKVYEILKTAQQLAIDKVRPGVKASEIDLVAREHIKQHGYGNYFIHRTGHGIGLEVHEEPYIGSISETVLRPGMVFSIEPGIYLANKFGIRIEDLVEVTENGCEVLNNFTKELIEIK